MILLHSLSLWIILSNYEFVVQVTTLVWFMVYILLNLCSRLSIVLKRFIIITLSRDLISTIKLFVYGIYYDFLLLRFIYIQRNMGTIKPNTAVVNCLKNFKHERPFEIWEIVFVNMQLSIIFGFNVLEIQQELCKI